MFLIVGAVVAVNQVFLLLGVDEEGAAVGWGAGHVVVLDQLPLVVDQVYYNWEMLALFKGQLLSLQINSPGLWVQLVKKQKVKYLVVVVERVEEVPQSV